MKVYILTENGHEFSSVWPTMERARAVMMNNTILECSEHDLETGERRELYWTPEGEMQAGDWLPEWER